MNNRVLYSESRAMFVTFGAFWDYLNREARADFSLKDHIQNMFPDCMSAEYDEREEELDEIFATESDQADFLVKLAELPAVNGRLNARYECEHDDHYNGDGQHMGAILIDFKFGAYPTRQHNLVVAIGNDEIIDLKVCGKKDGPYSTPTFRMWHDPLWLQCSCMTSYFAPDDLKQVKELVDGAYVDESLLAGQAFKESLNAMINNLTRLQT